MASLRAFHFLVVLLGIVLHVTALPNVRLPRANTNQTEYEYIVVGSGAGGGVVAARLALAGHSVLLLEAGDDEGKNLNYSVPAYHPRSTEDPLMAWNFFVRHYADDERQKLDFKLTYTTPDGGEYTGLDPPPGSTIKGVLYPRSATLGGCTAHNAMIAVYPYRDDFDSIASLTGDSSWSASNMRKYFVKMEKNEYLQSLLSPGHGFNGWLGVDVAPVTLVTEDVRLLSMIQGAAEALSGFFGLVVNVASFLLGDANGDSAARDSTPALYQVPLTTANGVRNSIRDFLISIASETNSDGSKKYPLEIRTNTLATKVLFDTSASPPKATGVSYLSGPSLYRADPRSNAGAALSVNGTAVASREVIVSGGSYNTPQLLKLSGVGPASELQRFSIPVVVDLPGVGANLQDHYESTVQGQMDTDWGALNGCTFDESANDVCLRTWESNGLAPLRGTYASNGFVGAMYVKSSATPDGNFDAFVFGGPFNFRGYFPGYAVNGTAQHNWWTWAILKAHPRNTAGIVTLRSADPREPPEILYNYFDTGSGDYAADLQTMREAIGIGRAAFSKQSLPFTEVLPGVQVQSSDELDDYVKNTAWGHHASSTCPIGADGDPMAVLDSSFRVGGVEALRVADASVYPKIPGTFPLVSTYMIGEKAADIILGDLDT